MEKFFEKLHNYKNLGKSIDNYSQLILLLELVTKKMKKEFVNIGIHLVLEVNQHRIDMEHSRKYEFANDLHLKLELKALELISKLPTDMQPRLILLTKEIRRKDQLLNKIEKENINSWILYFEPWKYYLLETKLNSKIIVNDFNSKIDLIIELNDSENKLIKNRKGVYDFISSKLNSI
jgi:hypothetical protein